MLFNFNINYWYDGNLFTLYGFEYYVNEYSYEYYYNGIELNGIEFEKYLKRKVDGDNCFIDITNIDVLNNSYWTELDELGKSDDDIREYVNHYLMERLCGELDYLDFESFNMMTALAYFMNQEDSESILVEWKFYLMDEDIYKLTADEIETVECSEYNWLNDFKCYHEYKKTLAEQ